MNQVVYLHNTPIKSERPAVVEAVVPSWQATHNPTTSQWPTVLDFMVSEKGFAIYTSRPSDGLSICLSPDRHQLYFKLKASQSAHKSLNSLFIRMLPAIRLKGETTASESASYCASGVALLGSSIRIAELDVSDMATIKQIAKSNRVRQNNIDLGTIKASPKTICTINTLDTMRREPQNMADLNIDTEKMVVLDQRIAVADSQLQIPSPLVKSIPNDGLEICLTIIREASKFVYPNGTSGNEYQWPVKIYLDWI